MSRGFTFAKHFDHMGMHSYTEIKEYRKQCGRIAKRRTGLGTYEWVVSFMVPRVPTEKDPAPFKWREFKAEFMTEPSARSWVNSNKPGIKATPLHYLEY